VRFATSDKDRWPSDFLIRIFLFAGRIEFQLFRSGKLVSECCTLVAANRYACSHAVGRNLVNYEWDENILKSNECWNRVTAQLSTPHITKTFASSIIPSVFLKPPRSAEFLFYLFLDAQNCDALVGDLEERYRLILKTFGQRRANFWYWTQAIRSVRPLVWAWTKKVALKPVVDLVSWAVAKGFMGHDSWFVALVERAKRLRS
jgi:hypothetical protein